MAGGFAVDAAAALLDVEARVVPRQALARLAEFSSADLEAVARAAAAEMASSLVPVADGQNAADQRRPNDPEAFAAMCAIIATCARDGGARTAAQQRQQLYALGVEDEELQTKLMPVLAAVAPSVERVLGNTSFDFAHVVDVSWRLDYVLRSSSAGSVHDPLYFVQLKLQTPRAGAGLETVVFSCSVEELRALVYSIQEAANEVEKLAAGMPSQLRTNA